MPEYARLRVYGHGNIEVDAAIGFLRDIQRAYNAVYAFTVYTDALSREDDGPYHWRWIRLREFFETLEWPVDNPTIDGMMISRDRLILRAVKLSSPGHWDLLGIAKVADAVRGGINDYYERKKDDYRVPAEQRQLYLENLAREVDIIAKGMQVLKDAGMPDLERQVIAERFIVRPLTDLAKYQDQGIITRAAMLPPRDEP